MTISCGNLVSENVLYVTGRYQNRGFSLSHYPANGVEVALLLSSMLEQSASRFSTGWLCDRLRGRLRSVSVTAAVCHCWSSLPRPGASR